MITLQSVSKSYRLGNKPFEALKSVDLTIQDGESVAIMGKSGAGKSTLLHILGCLDTYDSGSYQLDGVEVGGRRDRALAKLRNERLGFVMQDFALVNNRSVLFNTTLPFYFDKTPGKEMKKRGMQALELVGLADQAKKRVNQLSGGQRQRVAIARAILKNPSVILADEPTGALDSETSKSIMELLVQMNARGSSLVVVTHDAEVAAYCKRQIVLSDGKICSDSAREAG